MPEPEKGEQEKEFIKRCVPQLVNEGYAVNQSLAICFAVYRKKGTGPKSPKPSRK